MKIIMVVCTRLSESDFYEKTSTGKSLRYFKPSFLELKLFTNNSEGLPKIYNKIIDENYDSESIIIFAHDDLLILDFFWYSRLIDGLNKFDIIGLAGNKRRVAKQPSWAFVDEKLRWDSKINLSGVIGHGNGFPPKKLSIYGKPRQKVKLLDGLFLAVRLDTLYKNKLRFDERFDFHFYDMDFCRQAEVKNLTCGTWDISIIHQSGGNFSSDSWKLSYKEYLSKWVD
jgi:hypothetical protein